MSFLTFILYIICVFLRPQDWVPGMIGRPLVYILGIATVILLFFESNQRLQDRKFVKVPQSPMLIAFFAAILMSHLSHFYFGGLLTSFTRFLSTVVLFFVILNAINTERRLNVTMGLIVLIMVLLVFQGMDQVKNGYGWGGQFITIEGDQAGGSIKRINWVGIFNDPNDLALAFVMAIGFAMPFVFSNVNFLFRLINAAIMVFLGYGVYLTNSRGGMLAMGAAVLLFFIQKTRNFLLGGIVGGLGAAVMIIFGPSRMSLLSSREDSAASRIDLWYGGLQMFKANPVFGIGYDMFMNDMSQTAHNSYVLVMAELGFVGLFFWIAMIYASMKGLAMVQRNNKSLCNYALGIQSALGGFCAAAFFLSRTYVIIPYMLCAMAGSVVWLAQGVDKDFQVKFEHKDFRNVFILCVAIWFAVTLMIRSR